jgi:FAD/FMN-containing dehydrogenase
MEELHHALTDERLTELRGRLRGSLLDAESDGWTRAATIWNGVYSHRPAAIARCVGSADVAAAIRFAREEGIPLAVRSGGHDFAGHSLSDGGLMVDLSPMKAIQVDPAGRRARVQPGVKWSELDHETQALGLATTGGTVSDVGVAGYTLGGGTGHLARSRGLAVDNVTGFDVVTADGELRRANEAEHPDLFWALRGGGGNFGIVTSFEYRLDRVGPDVLAGQVVHPIEAAGDALRFYRDFTASAPEELACYAFILRAPPVEPFPAEVQGRPVLSLVAVHVGNADAAREAVRPLEAFGSPLLGGFERMPYVVAQSMFDEAMPAGHRRASRAQLFDEISDGAIDTFVHFAAGLEGPFTSAYFEPYGGAIARVPSDATAYPHRDRAFGLHIVADWVDAEDDRRMRAWASEFHDAMAAHTRPGVYVNLLSHEEAARVPEAYGPNLERLARVKAKYDPHNMFRCNQNISPATDG